MTARRLLRLLSIGVAAAVGYAAPAEAGCTVSSGAATLASSTSYDVRAGTVPVVAGSAGLNCSGAAISLLGGSYARATVTSANGYVLKTTGGAGVAYAVSADAAGQQTFTQGGTVDYASGTLLSLLGIGGGTAFNTSLYARLIAQPNLPAGTYRDTLTIAWDYSICNGVQVALVCVDYERNKVTTTVAVTLVVTNDCRIAAPALSFGSVALVRQFQPVAQSVLVDCTLGTTYKVAFTAGRSGNARPWRTMTDGAGHVLQYNLYRADGVTIWDETNPLPAAAAGTGAVTPAQAQAYVAKVNPAQATPVAGAYADQLTVVVTF
ncbi:spore coat protein U domain-containing protein [Sphingomonas adhaesiva]|uniref:spore coat protein U domain-containing protein n=1 Tax=Sphingomonas adhaesiva TaxID=28212 RepID=UPI002FFD54AC